MSQLVLQLLGSFELQSSDGFSIRIASKKARVLLAYLAAKPGYSCSRLEIANLLWEFHDEQQALTNLRQILAVLNGILSEQSPDWLERQENFLTLNPTLFRIDTDQTRNVPDSIEDLSPVAELFIGEFLEGLSFHEPGLNDWLNSQRELCQNQQIEWRSRLLSKQIDIGIYDDACPNAEALVQLEPLEENYHRQLMVIYSRLGQRHRVLRQYQLCCQILESHELGEPQVETKELFQSLYHETQIKPVIEAVPTSGANDEHSEPIPAIAVLPFQELMARSEGVSLTHALTIEIVNELRRFHGFKVISALSSLSLKGQAYDMGTASSILGARYLVSGTVQQINHKVQIAVELVDAITGELIWADRFQRQFEDLFVLQVELARGIAGAIEPEAVGHAYLATVGKPIESMTAWDLVLRGDHELFKQIGTRWNSDQAQKFYQQAIEIDPNYAPSYSGLAYSLCLELKENIASDSKLVERKMLETAQEAVNLDNSNPWCLVVLARAQQQLKEYESAIINYRNAVELCPSSSRAHFGLSFGLSSTGEYDEAVAAADRAIELSPRDPMGWSFHIVKSLSYIYSGQFEKAAATAGIAATSPSANHWAPAVMAPSLVHLGRYDDALKVLDCARKMKPDITVDTVEGAFTTRNEADSLAIREGLIEAGLNRK